MHAHQVTRYKKPITTTEVEEPHVGASDVLVAVRAAGLNQLDEKVRAGEFRQILRYRPPFVLGHDVAGTVLAVGPDVAGFAVGDEVYARPRDGRIGTFAERISIDQADVAHRPRAVSMLEAGSLPLVSLTAWQALVERGRLSPGQKVLIHAGSGGVGTIAIQLAKHLGAYVATTASARNADFLRELGADLVVDHRGERFEDHVHDYDLVIDSLGPEHVLRSLSVVRPGGTVIGISGPPDPAFAARAGLSRVLRLAIALLSRKVRRAARSRGVNYEFLLMRASGEQLERISALVDDGAIRPVVDSTISFDEVPGRLRENSSAAAPGKIVMTFD